jgi:hypothetical protein
VSAREFRNQPIDRRRLTEPSRSQYSPTSTQEALARVKSYREFNNYESNRPRFTTEQKPGSGGLYPGRYAQANRRNVESAKEARAEALRADDPSDYSADKNEYEDNRDLQPKVTAAGLAAEANGKYI